MFIYVHLAHNNFTKSLASLMIPHMHQPTNYCSGTFPTQFYEVIKEINQTYIHSSLDDDERDMG
jgi:hypothetical protein